MWQQADRPGRCIALGCLLALATAFHYYAFLGFVPLAMAEAARSLRTRRIQVPVWIAMAVGVLPLLAFWPLLSHFRSHYGPHFWAVPTLTGLPTVYNSLLNLGASWGAGISIALMLALVVAILPGRLGTLVKTRSTIANEELVLILGLIAVPALAYLFARTTHSGMTPRYALPTLLGISLAVPVFVAAIGQELAMSLSYLVLFVFISQQAAHALRDHSPVARASQFSDELELKQAIERSGTENLQVVVSNGLDYLPMAYYNSQSPMISVEYLADPEQVLEFADSDTVDLGLLKLRDYLPLDIQPVPGFLREHTRFLLYSGGDSRWDWLPQYLPKHGFTVRAVDVQRPTELLDSWHVLYLVEARRTAASN
jgi:hypothetical protein